MPRRTPWLLLAFVAAVAVAVWSWQRLCFTCDDAYIAFRYVSNAHLGRGLVWNPAPFQPVEGYSCFLWVIVLWACWSVTGLEPPAVANVLSLLCGIATLALCARWLCGIGWRERAAAWRPLWLLLTLSGIAANVTFASWLSSGLETALFGLLVTWWVFECWRLERSDVLAGLLRLSAAAALMALARPDGLLFVGVTALLAASRLRGGRWRAALLGASPLLLVALHVAWRLGYYGALLPNTYYAKTVGAWPESGARYLLAFAIEDGLWLWLPLQLAAVAVSWRQRRWSLPRAAAVAALVLHAGYYTVSIGGDHFEYRVFAHLVPLLFVSTCQAASSLLRRPVAIAALLLLFGVAADALGWVHTSAMQGRGLYGYAAIADRAPWPLRSVLHQYDRARAWLRWNMVCLPRQAHVAVAAELGAALPPRQEGQRIGFDDRPTLVAPAVGLIAWRLPNVAVIDSLGLNDYVIARQPVVRPPKVAFGAEQLRPLLQSADADGDGGLDAGELRRSLQPFLPDLFARSSDLNRDTVLDLLRLISDADGDGKVDLQELAAIPRLLTERRQMAHDRRPPPGYLEGFEPNVTFADGHAEVHPRATPLSDAAIAAWEAKYR